jgi:hypothetical protein
MHVCGISTLATSQKQQRQKVFFQTNICLLQIKCDKAKTFLSSVITHVSGHSTISLYRSFYCSYQIRLARGFLKKETREKREDT